MDPFKVYWSVLQACLPYLFIVVLFLQQYPLSVVLFGQLLVDVVSGVVGGVVVVTIKFS